MKRATGAKAASRPGGRGLLDVRLPRATPTWTARLDARHMAFLKDHKVESHVIFPAAAFVDIVLEAGVQLFEGRPFVVEDFEIRKPLILPDPASGVHLELSYDPNERTFAIQSRFEQGAAWSLHVVGSMRGERTESAFAASAWEGALGRLGLEPVEVEGFYSLHERSRPALRRGIPADPRTVRRAAASRRARSALSEAIARRAGEYPLHPVLFDGALQIFSAGAATVERSPLAMKLPVRFARILFLRSPGAFARVRAGVLQCNDEFVEGRIELYDEAGQPCVLVDGFRAISVAGAAPRLRRVAARDVLYHVDWERTPARRRTPCAAHTAPLEQPARRRPARAGSSPRHARPRRARSRDGRRRRSRRRAARPRPARNGRDGRRGVFTADSLRRRRADAAGLRAA